MNGYVDVYSLIVAELGPNATSLVKGGLSQSGDKLPLLAGPWPASGGSTDRPEVCQASMDGNDV